MLLKDCRITELFFQSQHGFNAFGSRERRRAFDLFDGLLCESLIKSARLKLKAHVCHAFYQTRSIVWHINPARRDRYFSRARSDKLVLLVRVAFDSSTSCRFSYFCLIWSRLSARVRWYFVSMIAFRKYNSAVTIPGSSR